MDDRGVCPIHDVKCEEWKKTEAAVEELRKGKLPIWVYKLTVFLLVTVIGAMNVYVTKQNNELSTTLKAHMETSNKIMKNMSRNVREIALNQKIVVKKLKIPYTEIPGYYGDDE
jgi:hypothetical protein